MCICIEICFFLIMCIREIFILVWVLFRFIKSVYLLILIFLCLLTMLVAWLYSIYWQNVKFFILEREWEMRKCGINRERLVRIYRIHNIFVIWYSSPKKNKKKIPWNSTFSLRFQSIPNLIYLLPSQLPRKIPLRSSRTVHFVHLVYWAHSIDGWR